MTLTKTKIIGAVSEHTGFTKKKSRHTVNALIEVIKSTLETGEHIKLIEFGKFDIKEKKARQWRSPFTGKTMMLPARRVVTFKSFKRLKDKINPQPIEIIPDAFSRAAIRSTQTHPLKQNELKEILDAHGRWLESDGASGEKAILNHTMLVSADLYAARLSRVDLQGADLRGAVLSEADLYEANLQEANLADAILDWASLDGANLKKADFQRADLRWANFEGSNMSGANLRFANLEGANLKGAKLNKADLYGTNLKNTDMNGAVLTQIKLDQETRLNLPKAVFDKYRKTFEVLDWSPALMPSA